MIKSRESQNRVVADARRKGQSHVPATPTQQFADRIRKRKALNAKQLAHKKADLDKPAVMAFVKHLYINRLQFLVACGVKKASLNFRIALRHFKLHTLDSDLWNSDLGKQAARFYLQLCKYHLLESPEWRASSYVWRHPAHVDRQPITFWQKVRAFLSRDPRPAGFADMVERVHENFKSTQLYSLLHSNLQAKSDHRTQVQKPQTYLEQISTAKASVKPARR